MSAMASKGETLILDQLTGKNSYTLPTLYATLVTVTPTWNGSDTEVTTGQWTSYARVALTGSSWSGASAGSTTYNALLDFGAVSGGTGCSVVGIVFYDASSGGNRLWFESLTTIVVSTGTHISFASGQFVATIPTTTSGNGFSTMYANKMLDHMTGKTTFGTSPSIYLCLCSSAPTASANGTELVYTGYALSSQVTPAGFLNAAAVVSTNADVVTNAQINFGADTGGTQTAATYWSAMDASSSGNIIASGAVTNGTPASGQTPDFPSGSTLFRLN